LPIQIYNNFNNQKLKEKIAATRLFVCFKKVFKPFSHIKLLSGGGAGTA
jgi:hypothetical protein